MLSTLAIRIGVATLAILACVEGRAGAQSVEWGVKAGMTSSSVTGVADYYDWLLCCHPRFPDARVDPKAGVNGTGGVFVAAPVSGWFGVQGELLFSRRQHSVDLAPFEDMTLTFQRDYIEAAALARATLPIGQTSRVYAGVGPVFGFRVGEKATSSDPSVRFGDPDTNIYVVQALAYGAPDLLRPTQTSLAAVAGVTFKRLLVEVRYTRGLQSIFKDRDGLVAGFVRAGGHEPTLRRLISDFGPFLESAKSQDLAVLAGFRF